MAFNVGLNALLLMTLVSFISLFVQHGVPGVHATRIMRRPESYKNKMRTFKMHPNPQFKTVGSFSIPSKHYGGRVPLVNATSAFNGRAGSGKASFAYFTNWGIYGANFQPTDIVSAPLTHILYSFADTNPSTGAIFLTDPWSDEQKRYTGDSNSDWTGNNLYGCLKQIYLLKLKQRNLKVLLSIGGWTYSQAGHFNFVTSSSARRKFVQDAVALVEDYGFDGIDIDYEYPGTAAQGQGFADLLTSLRTAFNALAAKKGDSEPYQITAAVGAGPLGYTYLKVKQMDDALDYWNLMSYDYAGSWLSWADNQANMYYGSRTGYSTDSALDWYISRGATPAKMIIGMPLYGRVFQNTNGLGQPYSGIGPGTLEPGVYSYKTLPLAGATVYQNKTDVTAFSYDPIKREWVTYDTPSIVKMKTLIVNARGYGGTMFWELSQDKVGDQSLVKAAADTLGSLDGSPNHIRFPNSKWANIRNNMQEPTTLSSTSTRATTTANTSIRTTASDTTTSTTTSRLPTPSGGPCAGISPWNSSSIYWGGDKATYGGRLWTAKWWTQGDLPSTSAPVWPWADSGAC